jgi:hypothetical protein
MGVIVHEEYVCDFCGKPIKDVEALVGGLSLRKAGARGLGRTFSLALHPKCSEKFTRHAAPVTGARRTRRPA